MSSFKLALHSVSYSGAWRNQAYLSLEEFLRKAASFGYKGVELVGKRPHLSPFDLREKDVLALAEQMRELSLECACIAGYNDFSTDSGFAPMLEMQLIYVDKLAQFAKMLGCPRLRLFTGYETGAPYWPLWNTCVAAIRECCKRAAEYGIEIGIQNHHDIAVDAPSLAEFIAEVGEPNCGAMFDAWAPMAQGLDLSAGVKMLSGKIIFTTAADYRRVKRFNYNPNLVNYAPGADLLKAVPMGQGFVDYKTFFAALHEIGYDGYVSYEMCSELEGGGSIANLDRCAKSFVRYMKDIIT